MSFNYKDKSLDDLDLTDRQREALDAVRLHGVTPKASAGLVCNFNSFKNHLRLVRNKAKRNDVVVVEVEPEIKDFDRKLDELSDKYKSFTDNDEYIMLVTSAQNGTPVHSNFWRNLNKFIDHQVVSTQLLVIPIRYKNPTSTFQDMNRDYWDPKVMPYVCEDDFDLNENIAVLGNLKSQPTAVRPLSGLEQASGEKSAIIGHTKLELKCIATPSNRLPKILASTGACTVANYTDSKAGYKGKKAHCLSAILIHVKGSKYIIREIVARDDGNFIDLNDEYFNGEVRTAGRPNCLSTGDLHGVNRDPEAFEATVNMMEYLNPEVVTLDDTLDFESASHHNKKDPIHNMNLMKSGRTSIHKELRGTFKAIDYLIEHSINTQFIIKRSNHDEHFERWVKETDPRSDLLNSLTWCDAYKAMVYGKDPYEMFAKKLMKNYDKVRFLKRDEVFMINDVAHDGHGDLGPNGARGSLQAFTKLGCPGQWGHSHTPGIMDDQYQNGTLSRLRLGYNRGPSSWIHCNTIQYADGKRCLLFIIDGRWKF